MERVKAWGTVPWGSRKCRSYPRSVSARLPKQPCQVAHPIRTVVCRTQPAEACPVALLSDRQSRASTTINSPEASPFCEGFQLLHNISHLFAFFYFHSMVDLKSKIYSIRSFFLLIKNRSDLLARSKWSVYISKLQKIPFFSFSQTDSFLCHYHLLAW